jgi:Fe2+ transport system protein B
MSNKAITIALVGNPNSGKTTVFNNLTGTRQRVGNWPGVTVEKKEGNLTFQDYDIKVVDLPGVYRLTAYSLDEVIARNFIIDDWPDVVVDIVDASNLERNLYLTVQLLEMKPKLIIGLNMLDVAESRGYKINLPELSRLLGSPVVPMIAARNKGTQELLGTIIDVAEDRIKTTGITLQYGHDVETEIAKLEQGFSGNPVSERYSPRWLAIKLLEEDEDIMKKVQQV